MDTGQADHDLGTGAAGPRRRRLLFAALVALGLAYVGAFGFFLASSEDFVARQQRDRALAAAAGLAIALPATLEFGAADQGAALLGTGWHRPEATGTWTGDTQADVHLPAAAGEAGWLDLEFEAYLDPARGELRVELELDGTALALWQPTSAAAIVRARVPVPARTTPAAPSTLRFRIDRPTSPLRNGAGFGSDGRPLGIHLRWIRLQPP